MKIRGLTDGSRQRLAKIAKDQLPGGLADNMKPSDFDKTQLEKGTKVEMEHTDDKSLAEEISSDHLSEFPNYYKELDKMEKKLKKQKKSFTGGNDWEKVIEDNPNLFKDDDPQPYDELAPISEDEEGV